MSDQYDVLLYISDQHLASAAGFMGDSIVRTPNLDRIAKGSFVFDNAYTTCPLCVPARASLMTGRVPSNIGVFNNDSDYKSSEVTFAHVYALKGYDTTLIGRMHFVGLDEYHGFTRRIGKDLTPSYWGLPSEKREEFGDYGRSLYQRYCLEVIGSGDSIVHSYDRDVVSLAHEFLQEDCEKPQLTVVGTYAPHFPYVGSEDKMKYYRECFREAYKEEKKGFSLPPLDAKIQKCSKEDLIELRAAYYSMVETLDEQVGLIYDDFQEYLRRNKRKGIFIYMSDHGDQIGMHGIFGKQTFFDGSVRIPLLMKVDDMEGRRIESAVSICDIAPTLTEINNTESIPLAEGKSLCNLLKGFEESERYVVSEFYDNQINACQRGYMIFQNGWKLITYQGYEDKDLLFNLNNDRKENENVVGVYPQIARHLKDLLKKDCRIKDYTLLYLEGIKNAKILKEVGKTQRNLNNYLFIPPVESRYIDESCKRARRD